MQLENIATPVEETSPQLRYASLHRAVERGLASDEVLRELVDICLQLGHFDEAKRIHSTMPPGSAREWVGAKLARRGLISKQASAYRSGVRHAQSEGSRPSVAEHVADAVQYLCQAHMPAVALLTMLAFPIIVGLGGFLTAGGSLWLFAGLAALPGLCVLGIVGAMGRHIFLQGVEGDEEIPPIPAPATMIDAARRHFTDAAIVFGVLIAPPLSLLWFEAPLFSSLPGLAIGMFLLPMALILRQMRGDLGALSPIALLRGIAQSPGYARVAGAFWLAFAPAALAFWSSLGHAVWLQIAIVGPLAVLPTFATARLLGTFTEVNRSRLGALIQPIGTAPAQPRLAAGQPRPAARRPAAPQARRPAQHPQPGRPSPAARARARIRDESPHLPPRPSNLKNKVRNSTPQPGAMSRRPPAGMPAPPPAPRRAPARRIEGRAPLAQGPRKPERSNPVNAGGDLGGPDLSNIPGARVITGEDRERLGAASRRD